MYITKLKWKFHMIKPNKQFILFNLIILYGLDSVPIGPHSSRNYKCKENGKLECNENGNIGGAQVFRFSNAGYFSSFWLNIVFWYFILKLFPDRFITRILQTQIGRLKIETDYLNKNFDDKFRSSKRDLWKNHWSILSFDESLSIFLRCFQSQDKIV